MIGEDTIHRIERIICDIVGTDVDTLYAGSGNIPSSRSCARRFVFLILHDRYGMSYSTLAKHTGLQSSGIMKSMRIIREYIFSDDYYHLMYEKILAYLGF